MASPISGHNYLISEAIAPELRHQILQNLDGASLALYSRVSTQALADIQSDTFFATIAQEQAQRGLIEKAIQTVADRIKKLDIKAVVLGKIAIIQAQRGDIEGAKATARLIGKLQQELSQTPTYNLKAEELIILMDISDIEDQRAKLQAQKERDEALKIQAEQALPRDIDLAYWIAHQIEDPAIKASILRKIDGLAKIQAVALIHLDPIKISTLAATMVFMACLHAQVSRR